MYLSSTYDIFSKLLRSHLKTILQLSNLSHRVPHLSPPSVLVVTTAAFLFTQRSKMLNPNADTRFPPTSVSFIRDFYIGWVPPFAFHHPMSSQSCVSPQRSTAATQLLFFMCLPVRNLHLCPMRFFL